MRIAVEGCAHGELDNIYATLQYLEATEKVKIDLLICCGDFQAVRNESDLEALACPPKYRAMNSFYKYYTGAEKAPYPTLFVGGNHEASNYLWELFYGGWVAPQIFFLGFAGVVNFGGLRIGGLSGIYQRQDYHTGHHERPPYTDKSMRSIYHVREFEVRKLLSLQQPLDIMLSHDWPRGIARFGDAEQLLRHKPFFRNEVESNSLGSEVNERLLHALKPSHWFSAHLHTKFAAAVRHPNGQVTKFLALDKCLPRRNFLQVVEFADVPGRLELCYDPEWMAITRAFHSFMPLTRQPPHHPPQPVDLGPHREFVRRRLLERGSAIPNNFVATAVPFQPGQHRPRGARVPPPQSVERNPQTVEFCELLGIPFCLDQPSHPSQVGSLFKLEQVVQSAEDQSAAGASAVQDPDEIQLDHVEDDENDEGGGDNKENDKI